MLQSANCKKQMERRTRVRRKSVTQSFTRCGAEFLRYCFGLAINYTRAIPIFQFTNSLTALLKVTQKVSAIVIKSKGNAKRALPISRSSMSGSSVRPGGSVGGACICREAASSSCAENCVRKGRRYCLSAASCRSPFLLLAISCTLRTSCLPKPHVSPTEPPGRTLLPSAHHKILDIPPEIPYTKQCAAGEIAVPCTRNPLQRG